MLYANLIGWRSLNLGVLNLLFLKYIFIILDTLFKDIVVWRKVLSFLIGVEVFSSLRIKKHNGWFVE
jgi:hypothetical protein